MSDVRCLRQSVAPEDLLDLQLRQLGHSVEKTGCPSVDGDQMLQDITAFLRQYLVCSDHQLAILALWLVHTWCFDSSATAAYLDIRSAEPESGKTLCLHLLSLLCSRPWLCTGVGPAVLLAEFLNDKHRYGNDREQKPLPVLLLDDCHHTFGPSERQALIAILNCGSRAGSHYIHTDASGAWKYIVYGPKAFAGNAPLLQSLAARCIPITLHRKKPGDKIDRFLVSRACDVAFDLRERLQDWTSAHAAQLSEAAMNAPAVLLPGLSARQQDCAEPLLHIADLIGGPWPQRTRAAFPVVFDASSISDSLQLLQDVRSIFAAKTNPEYLPTSDILSLLAALDFRPWGAWTATSGKRLGRLLYPFNVFSRNIQVASDKCFKGYFLRDLQEAWDRYLPPPLAPPPKS